MQTYAISDKGKKREQNEDCCRAVNIGTSVLLIMADGMGGHNCGERASGLAVQTVEEYIKSRLTEKMLPGQIMMLLSEAVDEANKKILSASKSDPSLSGMGTTCDVCLIFKNTAYIAHVGDSRVYKISPDKEITRLTKDHSLVEYMIESGAITPEEASNHPKKNIITRALGEGTAEADISFEKLSDGDVILLCSDGLTNMVEEKQIAKVVVKEKNPEKAASVLVKLANDAGGNDNISVIIATSKSGIYGG